MTTLIEQLITKLGLRDEPHVLQKTTELVRLLELKSTNVPLQMNEYGKIVICAQLAAETFNIPIDIVQAFKLAGLRKSSYLSKKRMFEKLLDLTKVIGVKDICIQLGLDEVLKKAQELFDLYKKSIVADDTEVNIEHPQYATMAVFFACKLSKRKVPKTKLMPFSNLRPQQFQQLEQRWDKFITLHYNNAIENKLTQEKSKDSDVEQSVVESYEKVPVIEDYEKWKERMLTLAKKQLNTQEQTENVAN